VGPLLAQVPRAAGALLGLLVDGRPLLAGLRSDQLAPAGLAGIWARRLAERDPLLTRLDEPEAARVLIAAGVEAGVGRQAGAGGRVHANLTAALGRCGPPGTMGGGTPKPRVEELARRLAGRLVGVAS
jgi:hypothetical protein